MNPQRTRRFTSFLEANVSIARFYIYAREVLRLAYLFSVDEDAVSVGDKFQPELTRFRLEL
jgi:hypothetical protein